MSEKYIAANNTSKQATGRNVFQGITLVALSIFWIGYSYALYSGNDQNISSYSNLILMFSLFNADVLFTKEKAQIKILNILAKLNGVLVFIWAIITIISLILK